MRNIILKSKLVYFILVTLFVACVSMGIAFLSKDVKAQEITSIKLTVDAQSYNVYDLPNGVKGRTYPVFDCYAVDNNGQKVVDIQTLVYDPDDKLVSVVDNRFATDKIGLYKVEYTASANGVQKSFTAKVNVVDIDEYTEISYTVSDNIDFDVYTGSKVFLYDTEPSGGFGVIDVNMDIVYTGDYSVDKVQVYDFEDVKYFIPMAEGSYTLKYTLTDITGEPKVVEKPIVVTDSGIPVINTPSFANVFEVNEIISFPRVQSALYIDGKTVYLPVKIMVNDEDVSKTAQFTPTTAGEYTVKYISVNPFDNSKQAQYPCVIQVRDKKVEEDPIINTKLYLDGLTTSYRGKSEDGLEQYVFLLNADGTNECAQMKFKNKIPAKFLSAIIGVEKTLYDYTSIGIRFTDSVNGDHYIDMTLKKVGDGSKMEVYHKTNVVGEVDTQSSFGISYDYLTMSFSCSNTAKFNPNVYENGDEFDGFSSGFAYFSLTVNGISGQSQLKLYQIAEQKITNVNKDNASPAIVRGTFTTVYNTDIGRQLTIPKLDTFDLLSENVTLSLTITSPSGKEYSVANMTEDYLFTPDEYGKYNIVYLAKDQANKTKTLKATINVLDRIPPQITVDKIGNVKVGDKVTFPKATVVDNNDALYFEWVTVQYDSYVKVMAEDYTWEFKVAGTYIIEYGASDEDGNYTVYKYAITCE